MFTLKNKQVIIFHAIDKYTCSSKIIGFTDSFEDAQYIFNNIKFKTFQANGDFIYKTESLLVEGNIENTLGIILTGQDKYGIYLPYMGFPTYKKAQEKINELKENTSYDYVLDFTNRLTKDWADSFVKPPEYSWY